MAYNPNINVWYQKYLQQALDSEAAAEESALLEQQIGLDAGSSPYARPDKTVGWQEANTRIPFGIGTIAGLTKNLMHRSGANYAGDTQAVMDAVAKYGPSGLQKTGKRYGWENQIDPIKTQGYIAQLSAALQDLPSLQNEWANSTTNVSPETMATYEEGGILMEDEGGINAHLFD